jgi:hypothetical protein
LRSSPNGLVASVKEGSWASFQEQSKTDGGEVEVPHAPSRESSLCMAAFELTHARPLGALSNGRQSSPRSRAFPDENRAQRPPSERPLGVNHRFFPCFEKIPVSRRSTQRNERGFESKPETIKLLTN